MTQEEFDFFITIMTTTIAICALALTIYNGYLSRCHYRISIQPLICCEYKTTNTKFLCKIKNRGLGSAIIEKHTFLLDNQPVTHDEFYNDLRNYFPELTFAKISVCHYMSPQSCVSKDEEFIMYDLTFNERYDDKTQKEIQKRYSFTIEYKSLYGVKYKFIADLKKPD